MTAAAIIPEAFAALAVLLAVGLIPCSAIVLAVFVARVTRDDRPPRGRS